jgi:hypothetical protein
LELMRRRCHPPRRWGGALAAKAVKCERIMRCWTLIGANRGGGAYFAGWRCAGTKYPDWKGQWSRLNTNQQGQAVKFDPIKPPGCAAANVS